ncbi:hypothetical protein CH252_19175 [Rhodococcus sp. 06-1477-1B]|nr:hypothetical protein CH252_19175 [Rhodococcus sp. 06-1477-1B]
MTTVASVEALITANTDDVDRADRKVKALVDKIDRTTATQKIAADEKPYLDGMKRVEGEAKKFVSQRAIATLDVDIAKGEQNLQRTQDRLEDLRLRADAGLEVTADIRRAEAALLKTQKQVNGLRDVRAKVAVETDVADALSGLDKVEKNTQRIVSREVAIQVNAKVDGAKSDVAKLEAELALLGGMTPSAKVTVDTARAEAKLDTTRKLLADLEATRTTMVVNVADEGARQKLQGVAKFGEETGQDAGQKFGTAAVAAIASIPIAGAVVGVGVAAGKALIDGLREGLQIEAGFDRLAALTGLDDAAALKVGRSASEAYVQGFGDSIESNMDTARLGLQFSLIDPNASTRDAQRVIEGLAGIADVLNEEVRPTATAVTTLLKTGLAGSTKEAFDLLAAGQREGVNRAEDLLDTFTEYPVVLRKLGLSGKDSLGLLNQGLEAGARNTDVVADALKEFQIRATDASESSADGFRRLGLNAADMTAQIASGGQGARDGLQLVLDKLRETEDPVVRNAAAVELFGTKAEDLGDALFSLDLSKAVDQIGQVDGAAQKMFDTLASNDASNIQRAQRNIEVAMDGIQGALAAGFAEPLGQIADFVSQNRGPVMQFFLDLVNGALDFGSSIVEGAAAGTEALGEFIAGPLADLAQGLGKFIGIFDVEAGKGLLEYADQMRTFDDTTKDAAASIRDLGNGAIEDARAKVNQFGQGAVAMGYLNDASMRLADALAVVGTNGEGARLSLEGVDLANLSASSTGSALQKQILDTVGALAQEIDAANMAGEGQEQLTARYNTTRDALISQIEQMGIGRDAAAQLVDQILRTPSSASTAFSSNAPEAQSRVQDLANRIVTLPNGSVVVRANTQVAQAQVDEFLAGVANRKVTIAMGMGGSGGITRAGGGPIYGPGGPRDDKVPVWASPGEHMWTAAEVAAAGGHGEMYRMRRDVLRRANGGPILNVNALPYLPLEGGRPVWSERLLAQQQPSAAAATPPISFSGVHLTGLLDIGADGIGRLVDGRISFASQQAGIALSGGEASR